MMQTRGEMGPGDYWQDRDDDPPLFPFGPWRDTKTGESLRNYHTLVDLDDSNRYDMRLSCTKCDLHSSWFRDARDLLSHLERWNAD